MTAPWRPILGRFTHALLLLMGACWLLSAVTPVFAATYPIEAFFRPPAFIDVEMSPDGRFLAGIKEYKGRRNLAVVDLDTRKTLIITNYGDTDVADLRWISNKRLIYRLYDMESTARAQARSGWHALDRDGAKHLEFGGIFAGRVPESDSDEIFLLRKNRIGDRFDTSLYRFNTRSGKASSLNEGAPKFIQYWMTDRQGIPRLTRGDIGDEVTTYYRENEKTPWRKIAGWKAWDSADWAPSTFTADGDLYVLAGKAGGTTALHRYDVKRNAVEPEWIFSVRGYDLQPEWVYDTQRKRLLGLHYEADAPASHWFDAEQKDLQAAIDKLLPGQVNRLSWGDSYSNASHVLVHSFSDVDAGSYYLFDKTSRSLQRIAQARPWIDPSDMSPVQVMHYPARDGLRIPAQLTLPRKTAVQKPPLVVLVHGGPYLRGLHWGWNPQVQFLASRGYAVLEADFRGSQGYGFDHFKAGWKQWGLGMQDDLADGVRWLAQKGSIDPARVCIAGASYGGYAVLMGLIKDADAYRCGVSWVGVTDIQLMYDVGWSDFAGSDWQNYAMPLLIGDPARDAAQLKATSPITNADRLRRPVLLAYGLHDRRVPYVHGRAMRDALAKHHTDMEYVEYPGEGHGWSSPRTWLDFWTRVEAFLARHMATAQQP
jgi:dipeptidyl aminopeptidase/acylaminoacyl peptidase